MSPRILWSFVKWLSNATVETISSWHSKFRRVLRRDTTEAICMYVMVSLVLSIVVVLCSLWLLPPDLVTIAFKAWGSWLALYLLVAIISNLFELFKKERAELFEKIKRGN